MNVDQKTIEKIAHLSRLHFDDIEIKKIKEQMTSMVSFVEKLEDLDTENVEPLTHLSNQTNQFRQDEVQEIIKKEDTLKNAPKQDGEYFRVPKIIDLN